jgi:hypothetical protein
VWSRARWFVRMYAIVEVVRKHMRSRRGSCLWGFSCFWVFCWLCIFCVPSVFVGLWFVVLGGKVL